MRAAACEQGRHGAARLWHSRLRLLHPFAKLPLISSLPEGTPAASRRVVGTPQSQPQPPDGDGAAAAAADTSMSTGAEDPAGATAAAAAAAAAVAEVDARRSGSAEASRPPSDGGGGEKDRGSGDRGSGGEREKEIDVGVDRLYHELRQHQKYGGTPVGHIILRPGEDLATVLWGFVLLIGAFIFFVSSIYSILVAKMMPLTGNVFIDAIKADHYVSKAHKAHPPPVHSAMNQRPEGQRARGPEGRGQDDSSVDATLLSFLTHSVSSRLVSSLSLRVCCAVLCCAVLCCAVLCCAVLCCAVLCYAVLCCAVLCSSSSWSSSSPQYCYLIPLTMPMGCITVIASWVALKFFRHN